MLEALTSLWQKPMTVMKIGGAVIVVLVVLMLASRLVGDTLQSFGINNNFRIATSPSSSRLMYDEDMAEEAGMMKMHIANQAMPEPMPPPVGGFSSGDDAEDFEVTEYNVVINTRDKESICADLAALKAKEYIIFDNANTYDRGCNYTFKVEHTHAKGVLQIIEDFDPDTLSENTHTIKRSIDYVTSEKEILEQKLQSINETLEEALAAYDEISRIATNTRDAESLATIIDSKVRLIERLTQERINVNQQLSRLERNKQQQLERLDYTYFFVSVREDKYMNIDDIKDSWKKAVQSFVRDANSTVQDVTVGMIGFVLFVLQYIIYFFILLLTAKFCWKHTKRIWLK